VSREGDLPLSFAQQRLWFLAELEPDESAYHIAIRLRLLGKLDIRALERSLEEIVRRHEALRTVFPSRHGKPVQKFLSSERFVLDRVSLAGIEPSGRRAEARSRAASEIARPFDLATGPLVRALLIDLDEEDHGLVLTLHHIVADGWSMGVFLNELSTLYGAFSQGLASPLPELPIQYADFASWQRSVFTDSALDEEIGYWKKALAGEPRVLDLPADFPRPPVPSFAGDRILMELPRSIVDSVRDLSRREGATLFMTLLAGFQTLLHRYTGEEDVLVGTPIANRRRSEVEGLIGFFVNTLVMRAEVSPSTSFRDLLRNVREFALGAYAHQDVPFEKLVEELKPQRDLSRNPFFQILFALQNQPLPALRLSGIELLRLDGDGVSTRFDLEMHVWERPSGLTLAASYRKDLFARETISRLLDHYRAILASVALDPETSLARIPLLSEEERSQLLFER
ncbi:MAG: condensation domain-containing protein, partial [Vicinamibacteria bacterium]